jgi:hypothetical protein
MSESVQEALKGKSFTQIEGQDPAPKPIHSGLEKQVDKVLNPCIDNTTEWLLWVTR